MRSSLRQLHKTVCRLLGLTLVVCISVSAQPGCLANCAAASSAHDPEALKDLHPAAGHSSASLSVLSLCHLSSIESNILAPALSCPTHAQLRGSMSCCSHAPAAAPSPQSAPSRIISAPPTGHGHSAPREVNVAPPALAVHDNQAERREIYLRHCVLLI